MCDNVRDVLFLLQKAPFGKASEFDAVRILDLAPRNVTAAFTSLQKREFVETFFIDGVRYAKLTEKGRNYDYYKVEAEEKEKRLVAKAARREERKRLEKELAAKNFESTENETKFGGKD